MIAFDLDDTLYPERDWALGGYRAVEHELRLRGAAQAMARALQMRLNPFDALAGFCRTEHHRDIEPIIPRLLEIYRYHTPEISLSPQTEKVLATLKERHTLALVTDGRARTQRLKIEALGLGRFFPEDLMIISEEIGKPRGCKGDKSGFLELMRRCPEETSFIYVGDNPAKDFAMKGTPGWTTVMIEDSAGANIHPQTSGNPGCLKPDLILPDLSSLLTIDI